MTGTVIQLNNPLRPSRVQSNPISGARQLPTGHRTSYVLSLPPRDVFTLGPKIFAPFDFDFYGARLTIRLIQKICANIKTIMIYLKYI
jgi:hypothetical protein